MAIREIPGQYEVDESEEDFVKRIKETPIDRSIRRPSRMTERPDMDDDADPEISTVVPPSILDEKPLEEEDDID
ncbi:MAG: hypothetical protein WAV56_00760 [Microgenomates group bacterium]